MISDAEILILHDAANVLRRHEQHTAAAMVFNALVALSDGGATGRDGIRSRDPLDRDEAKREGIAARGSSLAAVNAACSRSPV